MTNEPWSRWGNGYTFIFNADLIRCTLSDNS